MTLFGEAGHRSVTKPSLVLPPKANARETRTRAVTRVTRSRKIPVEMANKKEHPGEAHSLD